MSAQTASLVKNSSITKLVSSQFPRLNKEIFLETAVEKSYVDTFLPINNLIMIISWNSEFRLQWGYSQI